MLHPESDSPSDGPSSLERSNNCNVQVWESTADCEAPQYHLLLHNQCPMCLDIIMQEQSLMLQSNFTP